MLVALAILLTLERHASLAAEQNAAELGEKPHAVNAVLQELRQQGLVDAVVVGEVEGDATQAASYWRLTEEGRTYLGRLR